MRHPRSNRQERHFLSSRMRFYARLGQFNESCLNLQQQGLSAARIRQFQQFPADESLVGDKCSVCQDEIEVGSRMMRLDCDGQHVFCKDCVEGWFADHKTCPNCRHEF